MLSKIITEENVKKAKSLIDLADNIVIVSHMGPDGDAVGSSLGLYHFFKSLKKHPVVVLPNRYPDFLNWLEGSSDIVIYEEAQEQTIQLLKKSDLILLIDFNELGRVDGLKPLLEVSNVKKIMVDHHPFPAEVADVVISHPELSSSSELAFRLICRMGYSQEINKACAECIYTGMMTDTGAFTYNSNQDEIYFIVSVLIQKGIDKDVIYRKVYNTFSESRMRLMGFCLSEKMKIYPEYHTALIALSEDEMNRFDCKNGDTEGLVNMPFSIKGIVFSIFMREDHQKSKIKISFRSQGEFPANRVAKDYFNGGGHLNAAGGDSQKTLEETVMLLEKILPEYGDLLK